MIVSDRSVKVCHLVTYSLWGATALLLLCAWVALGLGGRSIAQVFGFTACVMSAVSAVCHLRILVDEAVRVVIVAQRGSSSVRAMRR